MKTFVQVVFLTVCLFFTVFCTVYVAMPEKQTHWGIKSCELSEISPDFTPKEKQDCRQARKDRT
jgi:hypothetical protein